VKSAEILVNGKVQGFWFRNYVRKNANNLELNGWVKNNPDRSVVLYVESEDKVIKKLIEKIKIGSPLSKVEDVKVKWMSSKHKFNSFKIIR